MRCVHTFCTIQNNVAIFYCRNDDASKAFSIALQLNDNSYRSWILWGEHLANMFAKEKQLECASQAMVCFLQASRQQTEVKTRRLLAQVLWLLKQEESLGELDESFGKYVSSIPPLNWIIW